jgi:ABC-type transporter Mla maintaining outer membrane lipid asymmetry ATPase subunit MlaF
MTDAVLEVTALTGPSRAPALFDVAMHVERGRTALVLGPIHSGKTMLLRHIVGLEEATSGTVMVDGEQFDARGEPDGVLRRMRTRLGVVFDGSALITRISALENVELPLLEHTSASPEEARDVAHELLGEVGLAIEDGLTPTQLDRASQRRVALARALALRPPVLLLDEPTQGLDAAAASEFDDTLARLQEELGFGAVIFSHEVRYAFGRADHIFVMSKGVIIEQGDLQSLHDSRNEMVRRLIDRRGTT